MVKLKLLQLQLEHRCKRSVGFPLPPLSSRLHETHAEKMTRESNDPIMWENMAYFSAENFKLDPVFWK